jgi:hypothetical protein
MSQPYSFEAVSEVAFDDREYIPMARTKGKLMVVRPLKYEREGFTTKHKPEGTDVVFADIAVLDPIPSWEDEESDRTNPGFPAGHQFRDQAILQGFLKGTFKRYLGKTLIGTMYRGVPTKGKAPMLWQDLSPDPQCVARGQQFLAAHPEFLIPVEASIQPVVEETGFQGYRPPAEAQTSYGPTSGYQQSDPWAQNASQPVSPAPASRPMSTLEQMRSGMGSNHRGEAQSTDAPF